MAKELIKKAATVEQAKAKIAAAFGVEEEKITFEVLQQPQKKTFGLFGGADAEVRGTVKENDPAEAAKAFLLKVLEKMGVVGATVNVRVENETCVLAIEGEDLGFIIGRRGETLDALQYLTGLVANRVDSSYYRINIDIGNYREKREQTLVSLAKRIGEKAAKTGRRTSLEPMNPYERRIIHGAVSTVKGATSSSTGVEPNRRVVISSTVPPTGGKEGSREGGRGGRNGRGGNRRGNGGRGNGGERRSRPAGERRPRLEDPPAIGGPVRREQAETASKSEKSAVEQEILSANTGKRYGKIDI